MKAVTWPVWTCAAALAMSGFVVLAQEGSRKEGGQDEQGKPMTLWGEIVDLSCYLSKGDSGRGAEHAECAKTCLAKGAPAGILTVDGKVTLLIYKKGNLSEVAGKNVQVNGKCYERSGLKALLVDDVPALKNREGSR